jgi:uncharacterized phage protein (TIGR01671 family)
MREIKFRAWSKELSKMFEHANVDGLTGQVTFAWNGVAGRLKSYAGTKYESDCMPMQFTGLHDKNGKEIWEGDLLLRSDGGVDEIFFRDDQGQFMVMQRSPDEISDDVLWKFVDDSEVIGNIYENPQLIS